MRLLGVDWTRTRAALAPVGAALANVPRALWGGGVVREPYMGAWQKNDERVYPSLLASPPVFACVSRIGQDISKCRLNLVQQTGPDIWEPTTNPAYSPVLRRPNPYQTIARLLEQWITSKLTTGNTIVLKRRDARGVVAQLHVLETASTSTLIAPDGSVFYELRPPAHDLTGLWAEDRSPVIVPAREVIHDRWNCFFHPLQGLPPLYAAALAARQGLTMQEHATAFFAEGNQPNGILQAPQHTTPERMREIKEGWSTRTNGVAVITGDLKYTQLAISSVDSQFVEQLQFTEKQILGVFGMPMVIYNAAEGGAAYGKNESVIQLYHDETLQPLMKGVEDGLDEGLDLAADLGTELDVDDLLWMDTPTRTKAAVDGIRGVLSPNEARRKYFALPPVKGGDKPMTQQQYWPYEALEDRGTAPPIAAPAPPPPAGPPPGGAEEAPAA